MSTRKARPNEPIAEVRSGRHALVVPDDVIERDEVVALLFNVSDIAAAALNIERLLSEDDGEEEADEG